MGLEKVSNYRLRLSDYRVIISYFNMVSVPHKVVRSRACQIKEVTPCWIAEVSLYSVVQDDTALQSMQQLLLQQQLH